MQFKNNNLEKNLKDILQSKKEERDDGYGSEKENNDSSINIQIPTQQFPQNNSKPPIHANKKNDLNLIPEKVHKQLTPERNPRIAKDTFARPKSAKPMPIARRPQEIKKKEIFYDRPQTAAVKKPKVVAQVYTQKQTVVRPATAKINYPKIVPKKNNTKKKTDPVSRYQNMKSDWQRQAFLKANRNKEGRKLDLDRFHKWSSMAHAHHQSNQV